MVIFLKIKFKGDDSNLLPFLNAYKYQIKTQYICQSCKQSFETIDGDFLFTIPTSYNNLKDNFESLFNGNVEKMRKLLKK